MRLLPVFAAALLAAAAPVPAQPRYGEVSFANSGNPAAQASFLRGLAQLHDFEYGPAAASFREAQAADPQFALAYWGEAMTYNHPVWMEQNAEKGRAALVRLAPTPEARAALAKTERERAWLHAVETLYGEGSKEERDIRYSAEMAALHARYPDDIDAAAFYALSILGTAHQGRDFATYMRAAAVLEEFFPTHSRHPGVLHYLIHSYDDPVHAPLGLRAARLYGQVSPDAGHALHMTSHIFIAMGMWDEVIRANKEAMRVVDAQLAAMPNPPVKPPVGCHHNSQWLLYGYLQQGKREEARSWLALCRAQAEGEAARIAPDPIEPYRSAMFVFADMQARARIDMPDIAAADPPLPEGAFLPSRFTLLYGQAAAAWPRDPARLRAVAAQMRAMLPAVRSALAHPPDYAAGVLPWLERMADQVAAVDLLAAGRRDEGLAALRKAAEQEQAMPMEFGPPPLPKPGWEMLGDELMRNGQSREAMAAYQAALARAPGRTKSLQGLIAAAQAAGDTSVAKAARAEYARYTRPALR